MVALSGLDYIVDSVSFVGFTTGYQHDNLSFSSVSGNSTSNGAVLGPYASYIISPYFSLDGQLTYTRLSNNISNFGTNPGSGFDANRVTGAGHLRGYADSGPINLYGFTGYAYSWQGNNSSVSSNAPLVLTNVRYGVFRLGGEAGYQSGQLEAYVPLTFEYQTTTPQNGAGRFALAVGAGLRCLWSDQLIGDIHATATELETHIRDIKIEANLRWIF